MASACDLTTVSLCSKEHLDCVHFHKLGRPAQNFNLAVTFHVNFVCLEPCSYISSEDISVKVKGQKRVFYSTALRRVREAYEFQTSPCYVVTEAITENKYFYA